MPIRPFSVLFQISLSWTTTPSSTAATNLQTPPTRSTYQTKTFHCMDYIDNSNFNMSSTTSVFTYSIIIPKPFSLSCFPVILFLFSCLCGCSSSLPSGLSRPLLRNYLVCTSLLKDIPLIYKQKLVLHKIYSFHRPIRSSLYISNINWKSYPYNYRFTVFNHFYFYSPLRD